MLFAKSSQYRMAEPLCRRALEIKQEVSFCCQTNIIKHSKFLYWYLCCCPEKKYIYCSILTTCSSIFVIFTSWPTRDDYEYIMQMNCCSLWHIIILLGIARNSRRRIVRMAKTTQWLTAILNDMKKAKLR